MPGLHDDARPPIEGYADRWSYAPGETVAVACSSRSRIFSAEIARVGGTREIVWTRSDDHPQLGNYMSDILGNYVSGNLRLEFHQRRQYSTDDRKVITARPAFRQRHRVSRTAPPTLR